MEEKIESLLNELAEWTAESPGPSLAQDIKHRIPHRLIPHRGGLDTINVLIDLRINKLTAAAAIIITIVLCANFFGGRDWTEGGMHVIRHSLGRVGARQSDILAGGSKYQGFVERGKDVTYYGDSIDPKNGEAILAHWRLPNGQYRVVFADFRTKIVTAEEVVKLQARMLRNKTKR